MDGAAQAAKRQLGIQDLGRPAEEPEAEAASSGKQRGVSVVPAKPLPCPGGDVAGPRQGAGLPGTTAATPQRQKGGGCRVKEEHAQAPAPRDAVVVPQEPEAIGST